LTGKPFTDIFDHIRADRFLADIVRFLEGARQIVFELQGIASVESGLTFLSRGEANYLGL